MKKEKIFLRRVVLFTAIMMVLFSVTSNTVFAGLGGNGPIFNSLSVYNENFTHIAPNTIKFTWETDKPATSRLMYGNQSQKVMMLDINDVNYGYGFSTNQNDKLVTKHEIIITNLDSDMSYFFRPESRINNFAVFGNEKTTAQPVRNISTVVENSPSCGYIQNYLRIGDDNDFEEVEKLQTFLRDYEGFSNLNTTGIFDQATFDAVSSFQLKYADEILAPWGITSPTGYVYYTSQKKINEIYCGSKISLTQKQLEEINKTKILLQKIESNVNGKYPNSNFETIGQKENDNNGDEFVDENSMQASVADSGVKKGFVRSFFSTIFGWFRD